MARSLSYTDAVRLLGGQDSRLVTIFEKLTGAALLTATPAIPALLGLFDAKSELVRLSNDLVRNLSERRSGLSRHSRTERLEAALTVIAVTAFFEAMESAPLPFRFSELALTKSEELTLASLDKPAEGPAQTALMVGLRLDDARVTLPSPHQNPDAALDFLNDNYYRIVSRSVTGFVQGLAVWDRLPDDAQRQFLTAMDGMPGRATDRYSELFRQLAGDFPEVACWASQREHRATRAALAGLEETLRAISTGRAPDQRRESLAVAYRAELDRRIAESGDVPDGIRVPTLGEAYLPPRFRAAGISSGSQVSEESWWAAATLRDDLESFLIGYLTSPEATGAPLLVLGQPGSGKSVLTRVLAARLPAADFLPIRVILRDVAAADDVQDQIEQAIRQATGERVEWPALARSAGDAMPVILLDGFDELLQAVGVSQTDYLVRVARFQRREAEQGRPVTVLVTSRTAVADRAHVAEGTVAIRLEPFDDERVTAWIRIWNSKNRHDFATRGLKPLSPETVLAHRELAGQPLLLLMLALYDADGNALRRLGLHLRAGELYEQLLRSFALREVTKHQPGLPERDLAITVESELRRLSVVAFAMFNRAAQWVTESDLERDLAALQFRASVEPPTGMRAPLREAELALGRFFFIHRARASQDETRFQTYEFLHATFGEYLVARLTWHALLDLAARDAASSMSFGTDPADDDLLRALLSFQPLSLRAPIVTFLAELASSPQPPGLKDLLIRLFRRLPHSPASHRYAAYRPQSPGEPARYAVYGANLLLLAVYVLGEVRASELFADDDPVESWSLQALLWRSQLRYAGWSSLVAALELDRLWDGDRRDVRLRPSGRFRVDPRIDLYWTVDNPPSDQLRADRVWDTGDPLGSVQRRQIHFQCTIDEDVLLHTIQPIADAHPASVDIFAGSMSAAHALMAIHISPSEEAYRCAARIATARGGPWTPQHHVSYSEALLTRLAADVSMSQALVADVLESFLRPGGDAEELGMLSWINWCAEIHLDRHKRADERLMAIFQQSKHQNPGMTGETS